jgi:hypothetical protein
MKKEPNSSTKWMSFRQIGERFGVSEATVRQGRGVFARLRRVPLSAGCIRVPRSDVERLDRDLESMAVSLDGVTSIAHRKKG